jgi:hypothetical protein
MDLAELTGYLIEFTFLGEFTIQECPEDNLQEGVYQLAYETKFH